MREPPKAVAVKNPTSPSASSRFRAVAPVLALGLFLLVPTATLGASEAPASSGSVTWAYAGWSGMTQSGTFSNGNGSFQYSVHTFYGWSVVFTQYNTSATTYLVVGERDLVGISFAQFCAPSCGSSVVDQMNQSSVAWQSDRAYANLTSTASVLENGTGVPALGLVNDAGTSNSNVTQSASFQGIGPNGMAMGGWSFWTSMTNSNIGISFVPALGLVPLSSSPGDHWMSTSNYSETASASQRIHTCGQMASNVLACGSAAPNWNLSIMGMAGLMGFDQGPITLQGGLVAQQDVFGLGGAPFSLWDVIFLIPAPGIIIPMPGGPTPQPCSPNTSGQTCPPSGSGGSMGSGNSTVGGSPGTGGTGPMPPPNGPGAPGSAGAPGTPGIPMPPEVSMGAIDMGQGLPHLGFVAAMADYAPPGPIALPSPSSSPPTPQPMTGHGAMSSGAPLELSGIAATSGSSSSSPSPGSANVQAQPTTSTLAVSLAAEWQTLARPTAAQAPPIKSPGGILSVVGNTVLLAGVAVLVVAAVVVLALRATRRAPPTPPSSPDFQTFRIPVERARPTASPASPAPTPRQFTRNTAAPVREANDPMDRLI